ncbi:MAG: ATP-binding protein [Pseudomonadota bacterium]
MNEMPVKPPRSDSVQSEDGLVVQKEKSTNIFLAFLQSVFNTLKARRHLLGVITVVLIAFKVFANISTPLILAGYVTLIIALAVLPRLGMLRPLVSAKRVVQSYGDISPPKFQAIIDAMPTPALMLNHYGMLLFINKDASEFFPSAQKSQHLSSFIRDPDFLEAVAEATKNEDTLEIKYHMRLPIERNMSVKVAPLLDVKPNEKSPSLLVSFRDLTEQERLNEMRSDFIANASHELRTPLASVLGFIETIQGPAKDDEKTREHFLQIMRQQIERMARLIDDLLSLSRVEMLAHLKPNDQVDLIEVIEYIITTFKPITEFPNISLNIETTLEVADVVGARDELIQLFQNLIQNSIKYGKDNGKVDIKIERMKQRGHKTFFISVTVIDDGPGIDPKHLPRLTERFYRVDNETSRKRGGTGLGLAIVKHIINRHSGDLKIESTPGQGSNFTILLPEYVAN